jgi:hypothetical protein
MAGQSSSASTQSSQSTSSNYIIIVVGVVVGVALLGVILYRRRVKKPEQNTHLSEIIIDTHPRTITPSFSMMYNDVSNNPLYGEPQPVLMMSSDIYTVNQNVEINPMFDETRVTLDEFVFEPDKLDNDDDVLQIVEFMMCDGCDSFDNIIEQVKGLPIHGKMLMISQTKREEFIRKIQHKNRASNEVIDVMSRLRKVKRNSISRSSTVITKMRAHVHWNRFAEKLYLTRS